MESILNWLGEQLCYPSITQTIIVLSFISALGLMLGKLHIGKISLGVTFVFFVGIIYSYFGYKYIPNFGLDPNMVHFVENLGLVIFIYTLGLEVGPSFFPSLKSGGIAYNILGLVMILATLIVCAILHFILPESVMSLADITGVMCGAVTNTPVLGACQTTLQQVSAGSPTLSADMAAMAQGCAVAYPMGVVGVIIIIAILAMFKGKKVESSKDSQRSTFFAEFEVTNPAIFGKTVKEIVHLTHEHFVISRIWRNGQVGIANSEAVINQGDRLLTVSSEEAIEQLSALFGKHNTDKDWNQPDVDWDTLGGDLMSKQIVISKDEINGVKLGTLRLRNLYNINITRILRAGIELLPDKELRLQLGDTLTVVGKKKHLEEVADILGDQTKVLERPNLLSFFFGLTLGCLIGMIPIFLPGVSMPVKFGLAGGPIIIGILMGAYGPRYKLTTYMTNSSNQMLQRLGIIFYLGALGLASGQGFFDVLFTSKGLIWLLTGVILTIVPALLVALMGMKFFKVDLGSASGLVCGTMANPMVLDFAHAQVSDDSPSVVYATVYPLTMFARIITAQIFIMLFI
ncbi:putative transporter [Falsiporphyromonas endometrii]|uniref:Transporter n=1 Tax=Falsiporphyromonas endometrii TaxID=1387297 RepID=A0ABV9K899_9PORP